MASAISEEKVRTRAHELWLEAGSPEGRDEEFWRQAQSQVSATSAATQEDVVADSDEFAGAQPEDHQSPTANGADVPTRAFTSDAVVHGAQLLYGPVL